MLGGFDARLCPGGPLALPRRKAAALLAYLALSPGGVRPREQLMALLWPDVPAAQAGNSLRQTLFALRAALGPVASLLVATPASIALDLTTVDIDVLVFERLAGARGAEARAEAAHLYRGDLLEDIREANRADSARGVFPMSDWFLALAHALAGRPEAPETLRRTAEVTEASEFPFYLPFWLALLGEGYLLIGRPDDAHRAAEGALALARQRGERGHEGWSLRLLGDVLAARGPSAAAAADECYLRALDTAGALGAEPLRALSQLGQERLAARGFTARTRRSGARRSSRPGS